MSLTVYISLQELCEVDEITEQLIGDIINHGIAKPVEVSGHHDLMFDVTATSWIKKAIRLQRDLDIDWVAVSLVIELLQDKEILEKENIQLQQRLQRFLLED